MRKAIVYASVHHGNTEKLVKGIAEECQVDLIDAVKQPNEINRVSEQKTTPVAPAMQSFVPMGNLPTNNIVNMQPKKKIYPNDPCPCGSGKKYKKCCGRNK